MEKFGPPEPKRKIKTLIGVSVLFALMGLINMFAPLDLVIHGVANKARAHQVDSNIFILEVDSQLQQELGGYPWADKPFAELAQKLMAAEPEMIVFVDRVYTGAADYPTLTDTLVRDDASVFVAAAKDVDLSDAGPSEAEFLVATNYLERYWGGIEHGMDGAIVSGRFLPSAESRLAGQKAQKPRTFLIDYAIRRESIETANLATLLASNDFHARLDGRRVIVVRSPDLSASSHALFTQGKGSLGEVVGLAALTMEQGGVVQLGFLPAWLFALLVSAMLLRRRSSSKALMWGAISIPGLLFAPVFLDMMGVRISVVHGVLMIAVVYVIAWTGAKRYETARRIYTHVVSGLPSSHCISSQHRFDTRDLYAGVISNYTAICSSLSDEEERVVANRIAETLSTRGWIYQGELGQFFWLETRHTDHAVATDKPSIETLTAIEHMLNVGIEIDGRTYVLQIAFGVDTRYREPLSKRLKTAEASGHAAHHEQLLVKVHDEAAEHELAWRSRILFEIDQGIKRRDISINVQPKYQLSDGAMVGGEVLARWHHAEMGRVGPSEFVSAAEAGRRIEELTRHIVSEGLRTLKDIMEYRPNFVMALNISPSLISEKSLEIMLIAATKAYKVSPANVLLEITENLNLLGNPEAVSAMMRLRALGFGLSIDDYGTGLSTLEYLKSVPASELKIDKSFITGLESDNEASALVESTIKLAHRLGMKVVAEGVEDEATLEVLRDLKCDLAQGYHLSRPLEPELLISNLRESTPTTKARQQF